MNRRATEKNEAPVTASWVRDQKGRRRVSVLTAYDATFARLLDAAGVDVLLVGDSLGMVWQGRRDTLGVTLDEMVYHTRAVRRGATRSLVVADLPFMTYHLSEEQALESAGHLVQRGGAQAVKLEGGESVCGAVRRMVTAGIPVMGHLGLLPQSVHAVGGFRVQATHADARAQLLRDARALESAGAFAIVLEAIPRDAARAVTEAVGVPTIGIGAGVECDGQVLVCYDLLGLFQGFTPRFVKRYAELGEGVMHAARSYVREVREGVFPADQHSFGVGPSDARDDGGEAARDDGGEAARYASGGGRLGSPGSEGDPGADS